MSIGQTAERLRNYPTVAEKEIQDFLNSKFIKFEFRPVLMGFIPEFYLPELNKIIGINKERAETDIIRQKKRDEMYEISGIAVFRVSTVKLRKNPDFVFSRLTEFLNQNSLFQ